MATVDYMIASYGPYAASATGGNGFARDFLAGIAAMYSIPSKSPLFILCFVPAAKQSQCMNTWVRSTDWNGPLPSLDSWPFSLQFRSMSFTGTVPPFVNILLSRRRWLPTGRRPGAESLHAVLATLTLRNGTCRSLQGDNCCPGLSSSLTRLLVSDLRLLSLCPKPNCTR